MHFREEEAAQLDYIWAALLSPRSGNGHQVPRESNDGPHTMPYKQERVLGDEPSTRQRLAKAVF